MADVEVSYENSVIKTLSASGQAVLHTAGKYCDDDITIDYTAPGGGNGITLPLLEYGTYDVTILANSITNTSQLYSALIASMPTGGRFAGFCLKDDTGYTPYYNATPVGYIRQQSANTGYLYCQRYRNGTYTEVYLNNSTYDASVNADTTFTVVYFKYSTP